MIIDCHLSPLDTDRSRRRQAERIAHLWADVYLLRSHAPAERRRFGRAAGLTRERIDRAVAMLRAGWNLPGVAYFAHGCAWGVS